MTIKDASRVATLVLVGAVLGLYFQHDLFTRRPFPLALQVAAAVLMLWARLTFGLRSFHVAANPTEGGLVTHGPYRFVRHPIYASILLFIWTGVAVHPSAFSVSMGALASLAIAVRIGSEERMVFERYPEYAAYAAHTRRIVPFIGP